VPWGHPVTKNLDCSARPAGDQSPPALRQSIHRCVCCQTPLRCNEPAPGETLRRTRLSNIAGQLTGRDRRTLRRSQPKHRICSSGSRLRGRPGETEAISRPAVPARFGAGFKAIRHVAPSCRRVAEPPAFVAYLADRCPCHVICPGGGGKPRVSLRRCGQPARTGDRPKMLAAPELLHDLGPGPSATRCSGRS
jgi:hypothetical protein